MTSFSTSVDVVRPLGVKATPTNGILVRPFCFFSKISDEHPRPFHMRVPPPGQTALYLLIPAADTWSAHDLDISVVIKLTKVDT